MILYVKISNQHPSIKINQGGRWQKNIGGADFSDDDVIVSMTSLLYRIYPNISYRCAVNVWIYRTSSAALVIIIKVDNLSNDLCCPYY